MPINPSFSSLLFFVLILTISACNKPEGCPYEYSKPNGRCECDPGFTGFHCETIEDSCLVMAPDCGPNGTCISGACKCSFEYTGEKCDELIKGSSILGTFEVVDVKFASEASENFDTPGFYSFIISQTNDTLGRFLFEMLDHPYIAFPKQLLISKAIDKTWHYLDGEFYCGENGQSRFNYEFKMIGDTLYAKGYIQEYWNSNYETGRGGPSCQTGRPQYLQFKAIRKKQS